MFSVVVTFLGALVLSSSFPGVAAFRRGLPWAVDNRYAPALGSLPKISWYYHWADGPVPEMPTKNEYVPMFWGPAQWGKWNARLAEMRARTPKRILAFNEPDIASQSNMNPYYAAQLYMDQIFWPWNSKGILFGSPAIAWNLNWMGTFLSEVRRRGGRVDFVCVHWYGSWRDIEQFKSFIRQTHTRFGKNIWVTEVGITTASWPTTGQVKTFMMNAVSWLSTQPYVHRVAWFGCFVNSNPVDGFASGKNAFFKPGGALTDMAYWYGYSDWPNKRSVNSRHRLLIRDKEEEDDSEHIGELNHCDEVCQLRNAQLEEYEKSHKRAETDIDAREPENDFEAREPENDIDAREP